MLLFDEKKDAYKQKLNSSRLTKSSQSIKNDAYKHLICLASSKVIPTIKKDAYKQKLNSSRLIKSHPNQSKRMRTNKNWIRLASSKVIPINQKGCVQTKT